MGLENAQLNNTFMPCPSLNLAPDVLCSYWLQLASVTRDMITNHPSNTKHSGVVADTESKQRGR